MRSATIIIERLQTGCFGMGKDMPAPQTGDSSGMAKGEGGGSATDADMPDNVTKKKPSKTMAGYKSRKFIGGMGGDMAFPWARGGKVTEADSVKNIQTKPSKKISGDSDETYKGGAK